MKPGMIETADTPEDAAALQIYWADQVVMAGLAPDYGVSVRLIRLSKRGACWGVFIERQGDEPGGEPQGQHPGESDGEAPSRPGFPMMSARSGL